VAAVKPFLVALRDAAPLEVIGEMRLDDRLTLARKLALDAATVDDRHLVVHAWHRWRRACVDHLFGDFAFVVTDGDEWFCARDRFGVRPLYYTRSAGALLVSNSLEAILANPQVDAETLDERGVADYLYWGTCEDDEATTYAHIRRVPPAHVMTREGTGRYWSLPLGREPRKDAPRRFEAALKDAVRDRVTAPTAVVFMSGGLDSTTLAALAHEAQPDLQLVAMTSVYRNRIADVEESFAAEAARSIGIPIRFSVLDDWPPFDSIEKALWTAEPGPLLYASSVRAIYAQAARHAPIAMHGHPADGVLHSDLRRSLPRSPLALALALARYTRIKRRLPWFALRELFGQQRKPPPIALPDWFRPSLAPYIVDVPPPHPLQSPMWSNLFEWAHPLQTGAPIELVYPWSDVRVVEAGLELAPFPWLIDKHVLRELLRGRVSETIRTRPKTYVRGDSARVPLRPGPIDVDAAAAYIDPLRFAESCRADAVWTGATLRAAALAYWLRERPHAVRRLRA
jgi:asparagine synthase (glutamine-hydrolysing)